MKKILFFNLGLLGHINPSLAVAEELVKRGHDLIYCSPPEFEGLVSTTGARFRAYDSLLHHVSGAKAAPIPLRILDEVRHALPQLRQILADERPQGILYDMMAFAGHWAAREAGIPGVRFHPSYAQNDAFRIPWPFDQDPEVRAEYDRKQTALKRDFGVPRVEMSDLFAQAAPLNLVFLPRAFQPKGETFDGRFVFTGPVLVEREDLSSFPWDFLQNGPVLYVSLGTIFNGRPEFFGACAEAFAHSPWRVVMALGQRVTPQELGPLPPNVFAAPFLPQLAVLAKSDLFLSHGGMNSVQGAIYHGVPLVVYPQMREQQESARRVAELGLGLNLEGVELSSRALREAVEHVAKTPSYRQQAHAFRDSVRQQHAATVAADAVEKYLGG